MKGLLLKDLFGLKRFIKTILVFFGILLLIGFINDSGSSFYTGIIIMYTVMLTITSFSIDESTKWMQYALSMPIKRTTIILEKYVLGLLLSVAGVLISLLMEEILIVTMHHNWTVEVLISEAMIFLVGIIMLSVLIPLLYRFGTEKARLMLIVIFALPFLAVFLINQFSPFSLDAINLEMFMKLFPLLTLIIVFISYFITKKIIHQKEY